MTEQRLVVDFNAPVGPFRGGAAGTLYGLGDNGVPTRAVLNGAHVTTSSQKAPGGAQHPSGDALAVEGGFFAKHGRDMYVYLQDHYPDWPYHGGRRPGDDADGRWSFLAVAERVAESVAAGSARPGDYVLIPFNEPDGGNWYPDWPAQRDQFLADWRATVEVLRDVWERHGLGRPRIGGPGDMKWQPRRTADFLEFAVAHDCLPDVVIWHELGIENLGTFRGHLAEYRALEARLGLGPLEVNITEYGMLRDMAVPGQLIQWFALFEDTKVDAQVAYWNYAGNLSDNSARAHGANGGWWLWKWYGDLDGATTVRVAPPLADVPDTLQAIGAGDATNRRATVLLGGGSGEVVLELRGLAEAGLAGGVDVAVREARLTGVDGLHPAPPVVRAWRGLAVHDGVPLELRLAVSDPTSACQVLITPAVPEAQPPAHWRADVEAETTRLDDATVAVQDPRAREGWQFLASGSAHVVDFSAPSSAATWQTALPHDGRYRLQSIGTAAGEPGQLAVFVDGAPAGLLRHPAGLALNETSRGHYRGSAEVVLTLTRGEHEFSVRPSLDGVTLLPGAEITLDRFTLMDASDGDLEVHPAATFRLADGARLEWAPSRGAAVLADRARADAYVTAWETGYHELILRTTRPGGVVVALDGCPVGIVDCDGDAPGRAVVHLVEGVTEVELSAAAGVAEVISLELRRAASYDADRVVVAADGDALEVPRTGTIASPGPHHVVITYANADLDGEHDYNPQVVDRHLELSEGERPVGRAGCRYTYSWANEWDRALPVVLETADDPLRLVPVGGPSPVVSRIVVAPLRLSVDPPSATLCG